MNTIMKETYLEQVLMLISCGAAGMWTTSYVLLSRRIVRGLIINSFLK